MATRVMVCGLLCLAALTAPAAFGETYKVTDIATLDELLGKTAEPGDVIEIQPGVHYAVSYRIKVTRSGTPDNPIFIRGVIKDGKRPIIDASRVNISRGVFQFEQGTHDVVMENLVIRNAAGSGRPGKEYGHGAAAARFLGTNITVRNCRSHHNENGFFASHPADYILIENCEIDHNGAVSEVKHAPTHNFYFCGQHQMVKNCYIHHSREGENFKSRGDNTIFAFNRVEEDYAYSIEVASGGKLNTLWLGNTIIKRTDLGIGQGRLLCFGDGSGKATGKLVILNNTFISRRERDYFLFTFPTSTGEIMLVNNVFAGPAKTFAMHKGQCTITGANNWIQKGIAAVPDGLAGTIFGNDAGVADLAGLELRPVASSPLVDAAAAADEYAKALEAALEHATSGSEATPSPIYLKALEDIKSASPAYEPAGKGGGPTPARKASGALDIGAYEYVAK